MKDPVSVTDYKHPRYTHRVRFPGPDGKRLDRFFTNSTEAEAWAKTQRKETGETGTTFGSIAEEERSALAFWRAFVKETSPAPPDLLTMMKEFRTNWLASKASVTVAAAVETFVQHQEADGASPRHLASLKSRLKRLTDDHGKKIVSTITIAVFTDWLNQLRAHRADKVGEKLTAVTRHNLTRTIRSFFVFCMDRGWTLTNPVPLAKRSKSKTAKLATRTTPAIMLPVDVARFMKAVQTTSPSLVPFWALKFFAGIRDAEAARMTWDMIAFDSGEIHLPAVVSKTGEARTMKIESNLDAWIRPYAKSTGPIAPCDTTRKRGFKKIIVSLTTKDAKGKVTSTFVFPSNAARHCFGTFHLYHYRNAGETALQLGHKSNPAMLHEHYKNPTAEKHAAAFWNILPAAVANVIPLKQAATGAKPVTRKRKTAQ